jgi:hypothetical protein
MITCKGAAIALGLVVASASNAHAGVVSLFEDRAYSFGWVSGTDNDGLYAVFAQGGGISDRKITKTIEGQRPGWVYHIKGNVWRMMSMDDTRFHIVRIVGEGALCSGLAPRAEAEMHAPPFLDARKACEGRS